MSVFKQFTTKDVVLTPFTVNKAFTFTGNELTGSNAGIDFFTGINSTSSIFISSSALNTGLISKENTTCIYNSIKQLYYSNYLSSSFGDLAATQSIIPGSDSSGDTFVGNTHSPLFDNYFQSTISQSRYFPTASNAEISVISIPTKIFGQNIVPNTFQFSYTSSALSSSLVTDDGNGNLISASIVVGQIFYSHGIAVFTTGGLQNVASDINTTVLTGGAIYGDNIYDGVLALQSIYDGIPTYTNLSNASISYSSSFQILELQYKCNIRENEFGYSLNPTLLSGSLSNADAYYDFATGSSFTPYVTTVGLYNNNQELLAIGKLSQPVPISKYTDTSVIINLDL